MEHHFRTDNIRKDLRSLSVRSSAATVAAQLPKFILLIISNLIILRFLTKEDVGIYGMATIATGLILLFQDFGLPTATVQKENVTHELASALFWINVAVSLVLMMAAIAAAPAVAFIFGEPRVKTIMFVVACSFFLTALSGQHRAIMQRSMRFPALAVIDIIALASGVTAGMISAVRGGGYWALVIMPIVTAMVTMIGLWGATLWVPALPRRGTGVRSMMKFGLNLTSSRIFNYLTEKTDYMLVGWMWGAAPLGVYTKGYQLLTLAQSQIKAPISSVATSGLSRLKDEPERYARYYLKVVKGLAWLTAPVTGVLAAISTDLIVVVLTSEWAEAGEIFRIFAFLAILKPVHDSVGWVFVSQGCTDRFRRWSVMYFVIIIMAVASGLPFGIRGVAASYTLFYLFVLMPWSLPYAYRGTGISLSSLFRNVGLACMSGYIMYGAGMLPAVFMPQSTPGLRIAAALGCCGIMALVLFAVSGGIRKEIREIWDLKSELLSRSV